MAWSARRIAKRVAQVSASLTLGLCLLLLLLPWALSTAFAREQIRTRVNAALLDVFQGRLHIERIGAVSLGGVAGVDARVFDAKGQQVLRAQGLRVDAWLPSLAWQFVAHADEPELVLPWVQLDHVDVRLLDDDELGVSLARAFLPRPSTDPPAESAAPGPHLRLGQVRIAHIWAHGQLGGSPLLDGELTQLLADLRYSPHSGVEIELGRAQLLTHGLPGNLQPAGRVNGHLVVPAEPEGALELAGTFAGHAAGSALDLDALWIGDELEASLELPNLPAAYLNEQLPGLGLTGTVAVRAEVAGTLPTLDFAAAADAAPAHVAMNGSASKAEDGTLAGAGSVVLADHGLSARGRFRFDVPEGPGGSVAGSLQAELDDPARLAALGVKAGGHAELSGGLQLASKALTGKASLSLRHLDYAPLQARNVELAASATGTLDAPSLQAGVTMDTLSGRAHADWDYSPAQEELALFVSNIDLLRFARVVGVKVPLEQATLGLHARASRKAPAPNYRVDAEGKVQLGKLGLVALTAKALELPTSVPRGAAWDRLKGELLINGQLQLAELSPFLVKAGLPIERTTGSLRFEVGSKPADGSGSPRELSASVDTTGLRVVQQRQAPDAIATTADARQSQPLALEGIDMRFSAHLRPSSGETFGTLLLRDPEGTLAEVQAEAWLPKGWQSLKEPTALLQLPLKAKLEVSDRKLGRLPALVRPPALRGRVSLQATLDGSLAAPQLAARISAQALRTTGTTQPVDVDAEVKYSPDQGQVRLDAALSNKNSRVASINAAWQGDLRQAGLFATGQAGLVGNADAVLSDFPLDLLPFIVDRQVKGNVSGKLTIKDLGRAAQLDVSLKSSKLNLGELPVHDLELSARTRAERLLAELAFKVGEGSARASLDTGVRWGKQAVPSLERSGKAKLEAKGLNLATLQPFVAAYVSEVGGVLDANTQLTVTPTTTELTGSAKLEKGVVQLPALGQRLSDISARVVVTGKKLEIQGLSARGTTGRVTGKASANLDGFDLRTAEAQLTIRKQEPLPLTLEGVAIGDVWGSVKASYTSPERGERRLDIDLPDLHLVTPEASSYGLQSLDVPAEVRVGVRRADGVFTTLPVQPLAPGNADAPAEAAADPLRLRIKLGQNVTVERGNSALAQLAGELNILTGAETAVNGRIELRGGKLDVQGKTFEIERGVVRFDGDDPSNPTITATARWDAPGYTVYADYAGDVKDGRIKLRAEPPLTPSEIANLILFGSPEGSASGSPESDKAALAVGVAGDTAAKTLNQVLDDFTKLDVSARVDTTTGSARPELVFQVSPRVSARVTRAIGAPAAGQALTVRFSLSSCACNAPGRCRRCSVTTAAQRST